MKKIIIVLSILLITATISFYVIAGNSGTLCCGNGNHIYSDTGNAVKWCKDRKWGSQVKKCAPLRSTQMCCADGKTINADTANADHYCKKSRRGAARYCQDRPSF
jgi:hypothetical protein